MPTQTESAIQRIESDPEIYAMAMAQMMALMQRELELRDALEDALRRAGEELPGGWIDWEEVIAHLRHRAVEGIIRDELRRNHQGGGAPHLDDPVFPDED